MCSQVLFACMIYHTSKHLHVCGCVHVWSHVSPEKAWTIHIRLSFVAHMCKMIISPGVFYFFKFLIFRVVKGVKGQKMVQNDKKFCPMHSSSQEPYIIWLSFMLHISKMIISSGVFFIFFKSLIFWVVRGEKGQKKAQNNKKNLSVIPYISGTIYHMIFIYGTHVCIKG